MGKVTIPERDSDEVFRCSACGFTTFERETARDHLEFNCESATIEAVPVST